MKLPRTYLSRGILRGSLSLFFIASLTFVSLSAFATEDRIKGDNRYSLTKANPLYNFQKIEELKELLRNEHKKIINFFQENSNNKSLIRNEKTIFNKVKSKLISSIFYFENKDSTLDTVKLLWDINGLWGQYSISGLRKELARFKCPSRSFFPCIIYRSYHMQSLIPIYAFLNGPVKYLKDILKEGKNLERFKPTEDSDIVERAAILNKKDHLNVLLKSTIINDFYLCDVYLSKENNFFARIVYYRNSNLYPGMVRALLNHKNISDFMISKGMLPEDSGNE